MLITLENQGVNKENYHIGVGSVNKDVNIEYFGNENQWQKANIGVTVETKKKGQELTPEEKKEYYLNISAMFNMAKYGQGLRKGTVVFFITKWKEEEYNGKVYMKDELVFISKMESGQFSEPPIMPNNLAPIPSDEDLPF